MGKRSAQPTPSSSSTPPPATGAASMGRSTRQAPDLPSNLRARQLGRLKISSASSTKTPRRPPLPDVDVPTDERPGFGLAVRLLQRIVLRFVLLADRRCR